MKIIACLNVYNERENLSRCIEALQQHGIFSIVVVDGVYRGYPHPEGREHSIDGTWEWLCLHGEAMGLLVAGPPEGGWPGQEIKRTKYLRLADTIAEPGDWLLQVDADEFLMDDLPGKDGLRLCEYLAELNEEPPSPTHAQMVYVGMRETYPDKPPSNWGPYPKLMRWQPGLYYGHEHWDVMKPDGQRLWCLERQLDAEDIRLWFHFRFEHQTEKRSDARKDDKSAYESFRIRERRLHGSMNPNPIIEV